MSGGTLVELWRYPVKSLGGGRLHEAAVDERGLAGDRLWSVCDEDGKLGSGKSTRRFRKMDGLLDLFARYDGDVPVLTTPDGREVRGDDPDVHEVLSRHVGRPVHLARESTVSHFDEGPLHLVTTASLRHLRGPADPLDVRRVRPNLVVDVPGEGLVEQDWIGVRIEVGGTVLQVRGPMDRCVMVTMAQPGLPAAPGLLRELAETADTCLGVVVDVLTPGTVRVGDALRLA